MSSLSKTIGIMQTSVLQRMSASIGKPACGQPPCQHHRRHAWRMRPACAADNAETPASRRELLLHGTAVTAALAVHALTARLARAEDGVLLPAQLAHLTPPGGAINCSRAPARRAGANPITGTGPPLSFAMPTQEEGVSTFLRWWCCSQEHSVSWLSRTCTHSNMHRCIHTWGL